METTIVLYCARVDTDQNEFFIEVRYSSKDPRRRHGSEVGLNVRFLGHSPEIRRPVIEELLDSWRRFDPGWISTAKPVFACRGSEQFREIPATDLRLMQHFACLQQRVAYEIRDNSLAALMLSTVYFRLDSFNQDWREDWDKIIGQ